MSGSREVNHELATISRLNDLNAGGNLRTVIARLDRAIQ
jgi:hypothetical protein